ncbi:MAG: sulfotransferase family protein [Proteobacteria bacterium]|nr:sulfotransferase family protein [Pseudomonadota bacterium]
MTRHICLWSGPRSVSTALMYSFGQRDDTRIVDEPLYGHYLRVTGANHPGREAVLSAMDTDGDRVMKRLIERPHDRPILFMKQMAHHLVDLDFSFLKQTINVLLIRDPVEMLPSLAIQLPEAGLADTGLATQCELLERLGEFGQQAIVLDSRELLKNPRAVLAKVCQKLAIPFAEDMLSWPPGPRTEDGVWARHWYYRVHRSTGFSPYRPKTEPFPAHLERLLEQCQPYYQRLYEYALKADQPNGDSR